MPRMMRLLSDDILLPTPRLPDPAEGADVDLDAQEISAALFTTGGIFLTADDWGNVILWTPRYEIGNPTEVQRHTAALAFGVEPEEVNDLDLFLMGGARPTTLLRLSTATC